MARNPNSDIYLRYPRFMRPNDGFGLSALDSYDAFDACDTTSLEMRRAIVEWFNLYFETHACCCDSNSGMRLPYSIVDAASNAVFGEYEYNVDDDRIGEIDSAMEALDSIRDAVFQYATIGGESLIKLVPNADTRSFDYRVIRRDACAVLARDIKGKITSIGMVEYSQRKDTFYTLCEKRSLDHNGMLTIGYRLFAGVEDPSCGGNIGSRVPLWSVPEYSELEESTTIPQPTFSLGLIQCDMPMVNCVDGSKEPVSLYAAAVKEIICAYRHAERTEWEYAATRPKLIVTDDIVMKDRWGNAVETPDYIQAIDVTGAGGGDNPVTLYSPTPKQTELEARMNQHLRNIENLLGFRRGQFSNADIEEKTATEILTTSARFALTVKSLQDVWEDTVNEFVRVVATLGKQFFGWGYNLDALPEITISWGNGVLYDEDKVYQRLHDAAYEGLIRPEVYVAELLGETFNPDDTEQAERLSKFTPDGMTNPESFSAVIG